jgi:hypothetical protein
VGACLSPSTTRQPTGKSSWITSGRDLTDVSHAVEPLEAISCDMGLSRVRGVCLLNRTDSAMDLAVNVLPNEIVGGMVISSGKTRLIREVLPTSSEYMDCENRHIGVAYRPSTPSIPQYKLFL